MKGWLQLLRKVIKGQNKERKWEKIINRDPGEIISDKDGVVRIIKGNHWKMPIPQECAMPLLPLMVAI